MKRTIITLLLAGTYALTSAQTAFENARYLYEDKNYTDAAAAYTKFAKKTSREDAKAEAYAQIGNCHFHTQRWSEAETWYKKAGDMGYASGEFFMNYGDVRMSNGDYQSAIKFYEKAKNIDDNQEVLANAKIKACISAQDKTDKPSMIQHRNEEALNTKYNDFGISRFGDMYVISSSRKAGDDAATDKKTGQGFSALYFATRSGNSWRVQAPTDSMFKTFNTGTFTYHEPTGTAYFTICAEADGKAAPCKIYSATYQGRWSKPEALNFNSDEYNCAQPAISADGKTIYFSSDKPGGLGNKDLYKSTKGANGTWMEPVNLGKDVNSAGDEVFPVVSGDSLLVYSSNGKEGLGGLDLYKAPISRGVVRKAVWMDMPFNSTADDFNLLFGKTTREGFYCSNRAGGLGGDDIYSFSIDENLFGLGGDVREEGTQKGLAGAYAVITGTDGTKTEVSADENGVFEFPKASPFVGYTVHVSKQGYFSRTQEIPAIRLGDDAQEKINARNNIKMTLSKLPTEEVKLENIYFEYDKANLTAPSKTELMKLVKVLKDNPSINIIINSHSDEQGSDKYNLELSERRAASVVQFLIASGIDQNRLTSKGWGESMPIVKDAKTEEGHAANRRTTFKITNL